MNLLEDVFIIENLQVINEGRGTGPMKIKGCFQRADEANNNKRIYRKPLLEREITKLADALVERRLMGELDHPQNDSVKLSNVSHLITGLNMKGNEVIGEAEILNTPAGKVAQALIEGGVKIGISSRGMGTVTEELDGKRYVNEDFKLITWDIVADPSTRGAYPGLTESTQIQEIIDRVYPEAQKVKNFTTLLKEELTVESTPILRGKTDAPAFGRASSHLIAQEKAGVGGGYAGELVPSLVGSAKKAGQAMVAPLKRKADIRARLSPESLAKLAARQTDSTQFVNFMRDKLIEAKAYAGNPKKRELRRAEAGRRAIRTNPQKPRTVARMKLGTAGRIRIQQRERQLAASPNIGPRQSRGSQSMPTSLGVAQAQTAQHRAGHTGDQPPERPEDREADFAADDQRRAAPGDKPTRSTRVRRRRRRRGRR